ncbi:SDR family oxidoreductase [uncultured Flavobacterium sp.]|uniref:SDR family NAD(P)-dependent oxidoreductase n=1 Tax=uncultured Flavobacterium sp. TaxID=165435 RepID=UPI0025D84914|nr:SDR family oxidoreductase [uncultured Flavobacterium sp.]
MESTNEKHALITGASSGIGYELAKLFAKQNYNLVLVGRNQDTLDQAAGEMSKLSGSIHTHIIVADLFEPESAQKIYDRTQELGITVNVLVNDAGQGEWGRFAKTDLEREISLVQLNIVSLMSLTKFYLKDMLERREGKILQLASSVSKAPSPYLAVYAATKAFVLSFTEALAEELKETGVSITALQPDATDTDFFHKAKAENTVTYKERDLYSPEEVALAGYEGLMNGDTAVLPGFMNKTQAVMNTIMPDSAIAANMGKQMESSMELDGRTESAHEASRRERERINAAKSSVNGDA